MKKFNLIHIALILFFISCNSVEKKKLISLDYTGKIIPKNSSEIENSPFGIQAGTLEDGLVARAAEIGVKWTRLGASWNEIEKEKGIYSWEETDAAFEVALKNGITPFITVGSGNKLYSKLTTYDNPAEAEIYGYRPEPPIKDPSAMEAYLKYVAATVERYKDKIDYWEVWVYAAIKLWDVINKFNPEIELWQGECGYPSHSSTRDFRGRAPWGLNIQAKWLLRQSFVDVYYCKATLSNYFKLVHTYGKGENKERTSLRRIDKIFGYPERGGSRVRTWGVNEKCLLTNPVNVYDVSDNFTNQNNDCVIKNIGLADYPLLLLEKASLKIQ